MSVLVLAGMATASAQDPDVPEGDASTPASESASSAATTSSPPAPGPASPPPVPLPVETEPSADDLLSDLDAFLADSADPPVPPPAAPSSAAAFNPSITAFGDLMTTVGVDDGEVSPESGPWLRSFEMDIRADVDPFASAVAIIAFHQAGPGLTVGGHSEAEDGDEHDEHDDHAEAAEGAVVEEEDAHGHASFEVVPEEVYIDLVSLPGGLSARVGQFKLPFGITNKMHPHDWPWPSAPASFAAVAGEEGFADAGAVVGWRVPNPLDTGVTLQGGAVRGVAFHASEDTAAPAWLGRGELFHDFGQVELGVGASGHGIADERAEGADLMLRWRKNSWKSVVVFAEAMRSVDEGAVAAQGWNATVQVQPTRAVYLGGRVDQLDGALSYAASASYYTSEFLRVRLGALTDAALDAWVADAQLTFVWGSHPVEPYWVNR